MSLPTPAPRASARTESIRPASLNLNSRVSLSGPSTRVAFAEPSSTASHRTPWLGNSAVGYHAASATKRMNSPRAISPPPWTRPPGTPRIAARSSALAGDVAVDHPHHHTRQHRHSGVPQKTRATGDDALPGCERLPPRPIGREIDGAGDFDRDGRDDGLPVLQRRAEVAPHRRGQAVGFTHVVVARRYWPPCSFQLRHLRLCSDPPAQASESDQSYAGGHNETDAHRRPNHPVRHEFCPCETR